MFVIQYWTIYVPNFINLYRNIIAHFTAWIKIYKWFFEEQPHLCSLIFLFVLFLYINSVLAYAVRDEYVRFLLGMKDVWDLLARLVPALHALLWVAID